MRRCSIVVIGAVLTAAARAALACEINHNGDTKTHGNVGLGGETLVTSASPSFNMQFLSQVTLRQLDGAQGLKTPTPSPGSSLWGWVDPLTHREYAIMGRAAGTSFVDVTDPAHPVIVASLPKIAGSANTTWREPKVIGNYAYIGVDGTSHGIQVVDLTKLRSYYNPPTLSQPNAPIAGRQLGKPMILSPDAIYTGITKAHTLAINTMGGSSTNPYLYLARTELYSSGIHFVNVANPLNPQPAGGFGADGITHEMQVVTYNGPDTAYHGHEMVFAFNAKTGATTDTFSIIDVTNKSEPARLASRTYSGARYLHQGWLTPDQRYVIQNDESDETGTQFMKTHFWDVSDLNNPIYRGAYTHNVMSVDHNNYVVGDLVFQANYTTGLAVFRLGNLASSNPQDWMTKIAAFDTYLPNDGATFDGAWNNYPFFPSGNIAISDINGGLIMVRLSDAALQDAHVSALRSGAVPEAGTLMVLVPILVLARRRGRVRDFTEQPGK